jgi:hypothetical protein
MIASSTFGPFSHSPIIIAARVFKENKAEMATMGKRGKSVAKSEPRPYGM